MSNSFSTPEEQQPLEKLNLKTKLAYGAGDLGTAVSANILAFYWSVFLTDVAGLSAGLAGSIRLISGIWDAANDPFVGSLSDRTRSRWGRRHPWMLFGAIPLGFFFFLHWVVPHFSDDRNTNQWGLFWFNVVVSLFFNTAYTAVNLPYTAMTPELTEDYNERTNLTSIRFQFSIGGSILSLILALVIFSVVKEPIQQYLLLGGVFGVFSVLPVIWCVWGTRDRMAIVEAKHLNTTSESLSFGKQLKIVFSNVPFLYVIGIYLFSWSAVQITASIIPYFVVNWMGLPQAMSAQIALSVQGTALVMLFVWSRLSERYGKKAVYFMGMSFWMIAQAGLFFLQPGQVGLMYVLGIMAGFGVSTAYLIPWSMMPDVIELDELRTGQRREGIFYGFMVLVQKIGLAIALFLVLRALDFAGYISSAGASAPHQPESALLAIRLAIGPLPTVCLIFGLILAYFYPITREAHAEILLKLEEKRRG